VRLRDLERLGELVKTAMGATASVRPADLRELAEDAPVVELVNRLMAAASENRASDIHVEPQADRWVVRFRIDGRLYERETFPLDRFDAVACRLKLIAGLDISERRLPQDGRFTTRLSGNLVEFRVSVIPGVHGESIVLRLLPQKGTAETLETTGMDDAQRQVFASWLSEPNGIVLVTGPTGSGKSTTLYAALKRLNDGERKIITVEDPVERKIRGVTQIQTHAEIGVTFAGALRSILRHDPDVIMVGEIRDQETAQIAIRAAMTGHLVLSTVHTNDAVSAFNRLVDMGVEPFLVASTLRGILAQRLVRVLCGACSEPVSGSGERRRGPGCERCGGTGFSGRTAIYEMVTLPHDLQSQLSQRMTDSELRSMLAPHQLCTLWSDGRVKVQAGVTTEDEILKALGASADS
jgi:general secretion pathway protein E